MNEETLFHLARQKSPAERAAFLSSDPERGGAGGVISRVSRIVSPPGLNR
jgi:hypothetical protein